MINISLSMFIGKSAQEIFFLSSYIFIGFCSVLILASVFLNFILTPKRRANAKKSPVATFSMLVFALIVYLIIRSRLGELQYNNPNLRIVFAIIGLFFILTGTLVNILGRVNLGKNWANQVTIYKDQELVRKGVFNLVRHTLYASLIWFFIGVSLVFQSWLIFVLTLVIFLPMMHYRARQEEKALKRKFIDYKDYKKEVGMFFPYIVRFLKRNAILPGNKLLVALFLFTAYFLKSQWLVLAGIIIAITPFFFTFGDYVKMRDCYNPIKRYIRKRMLGTVVKFDINEIRFTLLFGFTFILLGFIYILLGKTIIGYKIVLIMAIFKFLSGIGICGGSYIYFSIYRFCPICNVQYMIRKRGMKNKNKGCEVKASK